VRAGYLAEINYNEGWNVFNAALVAQHHLLYPVRYGWTSVNYPMLWFVLLAQLHRLTGDYLFTARTLSLLGLLGSSILLGAIAHRLGVSLRAAFLTACFSIALFASSAEQYVGMADPQLFSLVFFLTGLLVYLRRRQSPVHLAAAALLFVLGGSIKHNPVDIPLAVLLDLLLIAPRRALWFSLCGLGFAAVSVGLNLHFGGPFFLAQLLAPRGYSVARALAHAILVLAPLLLPLGLALVSAYQLRHNPERRIAALLLATSLGFGLYFSGGSGVAVNALFSLLLAIALLCGLSFDPRPTTRTANPIPASALFAWLLIPWLLVPHFAKISWNPLRRLAATRSSARQFEAQTALLRRTPGPALCESLLLCFFAGKPYVYDPFNATRLISEHLLDPAPLLAAIRSRRFGAIQFDDPLAEERHSERFDPAVVQAIADSYQAVPQPDPQPGPQPDQQSGWGTILFPRP
jgi:hypothetical protein